MESKHTPGPWEYDGPPHNIIVWSSPENRICFMTSDGPTEANARLIAAAPELAGELKRMVDHFSAWANDHADEATCETWAALHCAREVLSKAGA